jgi:hypothetical protein
MKSYRKGGQRMRIASAAPSEKERGSFLKDDSCTGDSVGNMGGEHVSGLGRAGVKTAPKRGDQSKLGVSDRTAGAREAGRKYLGVNGAGITLNPAPSGSKTNYDK